MEKVRQGKKAVILSIRGKTLLIVSATVLIITISTLGAGMFISQYRFMQTVKTDLHTICQISSAMLSAEHNGLRETTQFVARRVLYARDVPLVLEEQLTEKGDFLSLRSLSVLSRDSETIISAGDPDTWPSIGNRDSEYGRRAFAGHTVITTTMYTPSGNLVFYVWTPIDENRVLAAALSGMFFSDLVSKFRIWETGSIFMVDQDGVIIAATQDKEYRVRERHNYIDWGKRDPEYRRMGEAFQTIIDNDEGVVQYPWMGAERLCAYGPISGTDNWSVAAAAPLSESPLSQIQQMLVIFAAVFLGLGLIAALIAVNTIAIPYEKMEELQKHTEAASESKTRFLANMSHEMRTPLNAIIGLSELELGTANLEGDSFTNVEKIYSAGMTLLGIINDLLDISKIESGKLTLIPVVYDVPSMINDTINLNMVRIGSKHIDFRLHLTGSTPSQLKGDELRVKQIFNNLLSNAFKYTDSGSVDWTLSFTRDGNRVKVVSTVTDTGIGIRREDQAKLFKDYYQANLQANYYVEGTGLGLSITKNLVKLMGGGISLNSEFGKGSTFTAEFYQTEAGDAVIGDDAAQHLSQFRYSAQRRSRNQKLVRADMSYATVLVVDDVVTNLDVTRGMLKPYGIAVDCVTSGLEAIQRVQKEKVQYNAIFMDHMMPGMDGIETVKIIRHEIGTDYAKKVPIIALTANALLGNESLFLENGFQAFLSKPIDILRLDRILNQWVRDKVQEKNSAAAQAAEVEEKPKNENAAIFENANIPGMNIEEGLARFDHDEWSYLRVLKSFVTHVPHSIETLKSAESGAPGFRIDLYRVAAHSIKGSSRGIGAEELGAEAEKLEKAAAGGDEAFIKANNGRLVAVAEKTVADIGDFIKTVKEDSGEEKPEKDSPDGEMLKAVILACEQYDMAALKKAIDGLDAYRYKMQPDLVEWMREQAKKSNFETIQNRAASL